MTNSIDYTATTPRFSLNNPQSFKDGIDYLNEHGYAVISDVLNDDDINESKALLWKFIETTTDGSVQRDDPKTWSNNWYNTSMSKAKKFLMNDLFLGQVSVVMG